MDREFECMRDELLTHGINLNTTAASEHVSDIELKIRVLKERARSLRSTFPFKLFPGRIIIERLANVVLWINAFPPSSGVSKKFSPRILTLTIISRFPSVRMPKYTSKMMSPTP
jgi:hypothetical protein